MVGEAMRGFCELCGTIIVAELELAQHLEISKHADTEEARTALVRVNEFDQLASRMNQHISQRHKDEAQMSVLVSYAATKVYAATRMQSATEPDFDRLRTSWRKSLLRDVGIYRDEDEPTGAAAPAGTAPLGAGDAT